MEAVLDQPAPTVEQQLIELLQDEAGYGKFLKALKPLPHPVLPIPDRLQCFEFFRQGGTAQQLEAVFDQRNKAIINEKDDPVYFGFEPQQWKDADELLETCKDILISGSNRAGKSEYAAKRVVQLAVRKAGAVIWCLSTSGETSIRDQQKLIFKYLPRFWKKSKQGAITRIRYSQAKGFSDRVIVGPNGSEIRFMNYQQDREVIEGGQLDLWWADEEIPLDWIVTLRGRTVDRKGKGIITFTPITGFTPSVGEYFTGASVKTWRDASEPEQLKTQKLWPGGERGKVPYILDCLNNQQAAIFFSAQNNPYVDWQELVNIWKDKPTSDVLIRLYGVTTKTAGNVFPRFGKHNIVPHEKVEEAFKEKSPTRYHVIDFAWNRNWFQLWAGVQRFKDKRRVYIYREWPDFDTYGEWAIAADKPDGRRGPAQDSLGFGIVDYKRVVRQCESQNTGQTETIFIRYGDPRSGAAVTLAQEGTTTILQQLEGSEGGEKPMIVEPVAATAENVHIQEGVNLINGWLEFNMDKPLMPMMNEPVLYVSDRCQNLIFAMKTYTGLDGEKGACKDPIDCLRYLAMMDVEAMEPGYRRNGGGSY